MLKLGAPGIRGRNTFYMGPSSKKAFDIASLFENGEQGFFYDPHTLDNSLVGQTVPTIADLSSNENHGSNANSAQQMLLEVDAVTGYKYLKADGVDDFYITPAFALPKPFTVMMAFESVGRKATQALFSSGGSGYLLMSSLGTVVGTQQNTGNPTVFQSLNVRDVVTHRASDNLVEIKTNQGKKESSELIANNPYAFESPKYIANFNATTFTTAAGIKLYAMLVINRALTDEEEAAVRKEFNKKLGIDL